MICKIFAAIKRNICILICGFILILTVAPSIAIFKHFEIKKEQDYISSLSSNTLSYLGKLKYSRQNYNAVKIDENRIFVIGKGYSDKISRIAEIFDINKGKTIKTIQLNDLHSNDFVLKMQNNDVLIIGKTIEIVDTQKSISKKLMIPNTNFTGGFASQISDNEVLLICGNTSLPVLFQDENIYVAVYNYETGIIKQLDYNIIPKGLFNGIISISQPMTYFNNKMYLFACDYKKIYKDEKGRDINAAEAQNCNIYNFDKKNMNFKSIYKLPDNSFPFFVLNLDNNKILAVTQTYTFEYNKANNSVEIYKKIGDKVHCFANFFIPIETHKILALGSKYRKSHFLNYSYIIDTFNRTIQEKKYFNNQNLIYNDYGDGAVVPVSQQNIVIIGLFNTKKVYTVKGV